MNCGLQYLLGFNTSVGAQNVLFWQRVFLAAALPNSEVCSTVQQEAKRGFRCLLWIQLDQVEVLLLSKAVELKCNTLTFSRAEGSLCGNGSLL